MTGRSRSQIALTLLEAIISIFVLMVAVLMAVTLLHNSLRYQRLAKYRVEAAALAERTLDEVRAWAWQNSSGSYNYLGSWASYQNVVRTVNNYRVKIDASPNSVQLASPSRSMESVFGARARTMSSSVVPVRVRVEWDPPSTSNAVVLLTYVGEPPAAVASPLLITQTAGANPLPRNGTADYSVEARDTSGNIIQDVSFQWFVQPTGANPGMGTMFPPFGPQFTPPVAPTARHGRTARLRHTVRLEDGSWDWSPGSIQVRVRTRIHGREAYGQMAGQLAP